jgi:hypothetical protein
MRRMALSVLGFFLAGIHNRGVPGANDDTLVVRPARFLAPAHKNRTIILTNGANLASSNVQ